MIQVIQGKQAPKAALFSFGSALGAEPTIYLADTVRLGFCVRLMEYFHEPEQGKILADEANDSHFRVPSVRETVHSPLCQARRWLSAGLAFFCLLAFGGRAYAQTVATPVLTPTSGVSTVQFSVTVTDATSGSAIYYTTDGSTPTTSSTSVTSGGTVLISKSETLKVKAVKSGYTASAIASATYQITGAVEGGFSHSVSLRSDGSVWTWGLNSSGQLGDGTTTQRNSPVQVSGLSNVVAIAAGTYHSLALTSSGQVYAWGLHTNGQIGDGATTPTNQTTPVHITSLDPQTIGGVVVSVIAISAGAYHSVALKSDGSVWTWGSNSNGQLGNGSTTQSNSPVQVKQGSGYLTGVTAIAAGYYHNLALTSNGTVYAWGYNTDGELGDTTTTQRTSAVAVSTLGSSSGVVEISAGGYHSMALKSSQAVVAWGLNSKSQVGDGTTTSRTAPVAVSGFGSSSGVVAIGTGGYHSLSIKSDGSVWVWGCNDYGQLGNGNLQAGSTPAQMPTVSGATTLSGGDSHTLIVENNGSVWMCGRNEYGQTGDNTANRLSAVQISSLVATSGISNSGYHSLAIKNADGTLWAFGNNAFGELGDGTTNQHLGPEQVSGLSGVTMTAAGQYFSLAVTSDQKLWAWGANSNGQLGNSSTTQSNSPVQVVQGSGYLTGVTAISAGPTYSVAATSDSKLWAWGSNGSGQLGDGSTTQRTSPVQVKYSGGTYATGFTALSCGNTRTMALRSDSTVWAWGANSSGQVGDGTTTQRLNPVQVVDVNSNAITGATAISSGLAHGLALISGTVWAWGSNSNGQLGDGTTTSCDYAKAVPGLSGIVAISAGAYCSYALKNDGTVWVWGLDSDGQLGLGIYQQELSPTQITGLSGVTTLVGGTNTCLALKLDGTVEAWGNDSWGQLGTGANYSNPAEISGLNLFAGTPIPTLAISSPANNTSVPLGTTQTLTATASETGGTIASVQYYIDSTLVYTSTTGSSYSFNWTPTTWGNFSFSTVATDSSGQTSFHSTAVVLQVPFDGSSAATPTFSPGAGTYTSSQTVTLSSTTSGATIYYTTDGSTPTTSSTSVSSGGTTTVAASETLKAIAVVAGYNNSSVASAAYTIQVPAATPTFSPGAGTYISSQTVVLSSTTSGSTIYYTTNGSTPTTSSSSVSSGGSITVAASETVRALAAASGYNNSTVASAAYTIQVAAATPTFSPGAGTYTSSKSVALSSSTSGATIYYTTDGSTPTTSSTSVSSGGTTTVAASETLNAIAVAAGFNNSAVTSAAYTIQVPAAMPTFSPGAGTYTSSQTVTLTSTTSGATIYYTTDGSTPTASCLSVASGGTITVAQSETLTAMAAQIGYNNSPVASGGYTIQVPAAVSNFLAAAPSSSEIDLSWTLPVPNTATSQVIQQSTDGGVTWTTVATLSSTATSYSVTGLSGTTSYSYQVTSGNSFGSVTSQSSGPVQPGLPPVSPTGLTGSYDFKTTAMNLNWMASPGATSYVIDRETLATGIWANSFATSTSASYSDTSNQAGGYHYRVSAQNSTGTSSPSNEFPLIRYALIDLGANYPGQIANNGMILGANGVPWNYQYTPVLNACPFLGTQTCYNLRWVAGTWQPLDVPGAQQFNASQINDNGAIVGYASFPVGDPTRDSDVRGVIWTQDPALPEIDPSDITITYSDGTAPYALRAYSLCTDSTSSLDYSLGRIYGFEDNQGLRTDFGPEVNIETVPNPNAEPATDFTYYQGDGAFFSGSGAPSFLGTANWFGEFGDRNCLGYLDRPIPFAGTIEVPQFANNNWVVSTESIWSSSMDQSTNTIKYCSTTSAPGTFSGTDLPSTLQPSGVSFTAMTHAQYASDDVLTGYNDNSSGPGFVWNIGSTHAPIPIDDYPEWVNSRYFTPGPTQTNPTPSPVPNFQIMGDYALWERTVDATGSPITPPAYIGTPYLAMIAPNPSFVGFWTNWGRGINDFGAIIGESAKILNDDGTPATPQYPTNYFYPGSPAEYPSHGVLLLPMDFAPPVLKVNSSFNEQKVNSTSTYAQPDNYDESLTILSGPNAGKLATTNLHQNFFGVKPSTMATSLFQNATVTITKLNKPDADDGLTTPEPGTIRLYAIQNVGQSGATSYPIPISLPDQDLPHSAVPFTTSISTSQPANLVPVLYSASATIPQGSNVTYWMEGVDPGPITLEYRVHFGSGTTPDVVVDQHFLVCTQQSKAAWAQDIEQEILLQSTIAGSAVDMNSYSLSNNFMTNRPYIQSVYNYYQELFDQEPYLFYWAGLAKLAGSPVYGGMSDMQWAQSNTGLFSLINFSGFTSVGCTYMQGALMQGNSDIFYDLSWQFRAYQASGIWALRYTSANGLDQQSSSDRPIDIATWEELFQGDTQSTASLTLDSNFKTTNREQQFIVQNAWNQIAAVPGAAALFSYLATSPVDKVNDASFVTVAGINGDITQFQQRWPWITDPTQGIWLNWTGLSAAAQNSVTAIPLRTRAGQYSFLNTTLYPVW